MIQFFLLVVSSLCYECSVTADSCPLKDEDNKLVITTDDNKEQKYCGCDYSIVDITIINIGTLAEHLLDGVKAKSVTIKGVSAIGQYSFNNTKITTLDLSQVDSLMIDDYAFSSSTITTLILPEEITLQQPYVSAFMSATITNLDMSNCYRFDGVLFRSAIIGKITSFGYLTTVPNLFQNCEIKEILQFKDFPKINSINSYAFKSAKIKLDFKDSTITSIGDRAFQDATINPTDLTFPSVLSSIGKFAFYDAKLTSITFPSSNIALSIEQSAFKNSGISGTLNLPDHVIEVGEYAFSLCPIQELTIFGSNHKISGWTVTQVLENAFFGCRELEKLTLEGYDITFDKSSFGGCPIKYLNIAAQMANIPESAFREFGTIESSITIPDSVTRIGNSAFAGCDKIKSVTFGENSILSSLGEGAFYRCSNMESTNIPKYVTILNDYTYYKCFELKSITLPPHLTSIENSVFYQCSKIESELKIPDELESIGNDAFSGCTLLKCNTLEFPDSTESIGQFAFYNCENLKGDLIFGYKIKSIGKEAFRGCTGFSNDLTFPKLTYDTNGVQFEEKAFYGCDGFKGSLSLPQNAKFNGPDVFRGCSGFTGELKILEGTEFDISAANTFRCCSSFDSLNIMNPEVEIRDGTFQDCSNLKGEIRSSITSIGKNAFSGCSSLAGTLHLTSTIVQEYAFYNCAGLNQLTCDSPLTTVGKYAFYGCSGLTGHFDCSSLSTINEYAFYGCSGLTGLHDCSLLSTIGKYAFYGCSGLTGPLDFPSTLTEVKEYAFAGCTGLSESLSFNIGSKLTIRLGAFKGCTGYKKGTLRFIMDSSREEDNKQYYYTYPYFLKIDTEAFEDTKFDNVYYLGRFAPDCGYDSGISDAKNIYTSANFANKTFCGKTVKGKGLSGGAIAGIVIAVIVVVAVIVFLVVFFILKKKKEKIASEAEMNQP